MKLKAETNTPAMARRALTAFRKQQRRRCGLSIYFEHGQWWISYLRSGASWSVCDAEGGPAVDGFDFELITEGAES